MFSYYSNAAVTGLIATAVITGCLSIPVFASGWAMPISMTLFGMSILLPLANAAFQNFTVQLGYGGVRHAFSRSAFIKISYLEK